MTQTLSPPPADAASPDVRIGPRGRYIPLSRRALVEAVLKDCTDQTPDREGLAALARRLMLLFHLEFFARREQLRDLYLPFNPDQPGEGPLPVAPEARARLIEGLDAAVQTANFDRLDEAEIRPARDAAGRVQARVSVPADLFDEVRFYGRGRRLRPLMVSRWFGLRRERVMTPIYEHVVFVAAMHPAVPPRALRGSRLRPGGVYLKLFRDIPQADLQTLYPNARVVMGLRDKLVLGVPAVAGGIPVLINILPAISVLFLVAGAYLGFAGTVEEDAVKKALAALSALGALSGFLVRQWLKYERQKLRYQKQVAENAYFNNLNNNAGFFEHLIGASEDSEVKEAFLAYAFLRREGAPLGAAALDARIEAWLAERFGLSVDFDIPDAVAKLDRFGLMTRDAQDRLTAVPLDEALARTERLWLAAARDSLG